MAEEQEKPARKQTYGFLTGEEDLPTYYMIKSRIEQNTKITISNPDTTAVVIRPFFITFEHSETEDEYMATSSISNGFELEATLSQARESYLRSLVDDLVWLQKHKEELSPSILEELHLLQQYIQIVQ